MLDFLLVFCTCGSEEEGDRLAQVLIERQLAACVTILPGAKSVYRWKGAVERSAESLLLIKTTADGFAALREALLKLHSYENPEIIGVPLTYGADPYLAWIRENVA